MMDVSAPAFDLTSLTTTGRVPRRDAANRSIVFTGEDGAFRELVSYGAMLELLTVGFYRFWLATNVRRYLWSNTVIGGDALEYLGTARELLFGFIFAMAILAPVYLVYFLIGVEVERSNAFASLPLFVFFVAFGQFAIYRARRYRLHRTVWRGVRFAMSGSGCAYAARAMGWGLLTMLSLGFAWPWAQAALERYKMKHTFYGELPGSFVGNGGDFFKRGWWLWIVAILLGLFNAVLLILAKNIHITIGLVPVLIGAIAAPLIYSAYKAIQWRWWLEGLRLGDVRADSSLENTSLLSNYGKALGLAIVVLLLGFAVMALIGGFAPREQGPFLPAVILSVLIYLATLLTIGVIRRIYFVQRVWKIVISSLTIHNLDAAQNVSL